ALLGHAPRVPGELLLIAAAESAAVDVDHGGVLSLSVSGAIGVQQQLLTARLAVDDILLDHHRLLRRQARSRRGRGEDAENETQAQSSAHRAPPLRRFAWRYLLICH